MRDCGQSVLANWRSLRASGLAALDNQIAMNWLILFDAEFETGLIGF